MTIHWCGTGLSAVPGLRRLINSDQNVIVWNRTVENAEAVVGDVTDSIRHFTIDSLTESVNAGDVLISMLPADHHVALAQLAVARRAHFVSSSYVAPEMSALDIPAKEAGVSLVNEVGLDPGIDHLMAHALVNDYRNSTGFSRENDVSFVSYCGGFPRVPNPFRYKFSWSPLGVLKALRSPSRSISNFKELSVKYPWNAITSYTAPLPVPEDFEVYPNRDSLPFIKQYEFGDDWRIKEFVRGTIRLNGWTHAWADVFKEVESLSGPSGDARLQQMSDTFWRDNAYDEGEADRVVLCVSLKAEKAGQVVWHKSHTLDAWGDDRGNAMARLVSLPVALAVESISKAQLPVGVSATPRAPEVIADWMDEIAQVSQHLGVVTHH